MTIDFDRTGESAALVCGPDRCTVQMGKVTMNFDSAMTVDALYLLMFRKFDAKGFHVSPESADEGEVVIASEAERLTFDADSGRLTETQVKTDRGTIGGR